MDSARQHRGLSALVTLLLIGAGAACLVLMRSNRRLTQRASTAESVTAFMSEMFFPGGAQSAQDRGRRLQLLNDAALRIEAATAEGEHLADEPLTAALVRHAVGAGYLALGAAERAAPLLEEAHEVLARQLGESHEETLAAAFHLAGALKAQDHLERAEEHYVAALAGLRRDPGPEDAFTLGVIRALADLYRIQERYAEAEPLYAEVLATRRRVLGDDHLDTLDSINDMGLLYKSDGRPEEAEPLFLEGLATRKRVLGDEDRRTLNSVNKLANLYQVLGRYEESEAHYALALEVGVRALGEDHPQALRVMDNFARFLLTVPDSARDPERALALASRANELSQRAFPELLATLALAQFETGAAREAVRTQREVLAKHRPGDEELRPEWEAALERYEAGL